MATSGHYGLNWLDSTGAVPMGGGSAAVLRPASRALPEVKLNAGNPNFCSRPQAYMPRVLMAAATRLTASI
jgi:hypothetical protein